MSFYQCFARQFPLQLPFWWISGRPLSGRKNPGWFRAWSAVMIENTVKIWRLNVRKRAAHVRGSAPLSLLLAMWTWGKLTYGLKNMINLLLLYCRADQCESDGNYRNSVNTLVYSYLLLWQHLPRWEWYLCRMLGPLPVCTWLDGVLSKNGMILSRRDGFAPNFKGESIGMWRNK